MFIFLSYLHKNWTISNEPGKANSCKAKNSKKYLHQIADQVDDSTTLEDIYKELALLADIEESEAQEERGEVYTQTEVENMARKWLK